MRQVTDCPKLRLIIEQAKIASLKEQIASLQEHIAPYQDKIETLKAELEALKPGGWSLLAGLIGR